MKTEFTNENFEHFLRQSADNFRMKTPEKIWQNLSKELSKRRRRFIIGLSTFLLVTTAIGYLAITNVTAPVTSQQHNLQKTTATNKILGDAPPAVNGYNKHEKASSSTQTKRNKQKPANIVVASHFASISTPSIARPAQQVSKLELGEPITENDFEPTVVDSYTEFDKREPADKMQIKQQGFFANENMPLSVESIINSYKVKANRARLQTEFYFTPTISYRKLSENKSYLRTISQSGSTITSPALYTNVNSNVTHKPDVGFELGLTTKYSLSNRVKLRSGIQFNVNRYDIKAFSSSFSVATITLNNRFRIDSLNTISNYSNVNGYRSDWLKNLSFQVSAPVGIELTLGKKDKVQFGIATTVQPTYVLGDRSF
ncbi:MAG: hypothetical protein M3Y85_10815, partial [Bacteroidota bacterium]|nr:hypothetical protein [Bacteroidota bacterium]